VRVAGLPLAGAAVRLVARRLVEVTLLGRDVEVLLVQYVVAVPGRPELAVVSMTTPTVAAAPVLVPGFDAIAATFAFTAADGSRLPPPVTPAAPFARPGESGGGAARLQAGRRPRAPAPPSVAAMRPEQR